MIFEKKINYLEKIINILINSLQPNRIYFYGLGAENLNIYVKPQKEVVSRLENIVQPEMVVLHYEDDIPQKDVAWIQKNMKQSNILVCSTADKWNKDLCCASSAYCDTGTWSEGAEKMYFFGPIFESNVSLVPNDFKVLAVIHVYNEADIIAKTIEYLLNQEVDIYLIDNWSDDGSYEIIEKYAEHFGDRIMVERFPADGKKDFYDWYHQLERTEQLNQELEYNWFIHYDADEMRISPWPGTTLREFIYQVDCMGYNLIDNTVIDFKLTDFKQTESIYMQDTWFDFGHRKGHFEQRKTWKKTTELDLKSSGGHLAVVDYPKAFPLKILNRHYPLRSIEQAERKIFKDRIPRFQKEKQERGWHGHYDKIGSCMGYIECSENLLLWDENAIQKYYIPLFFRIGIRRDFTEEERTVCNEYGVGSETRIVLYGAGDLGKLVYQKLASRTKIILWVDKKYKAMECFNGETIRSPKEILEVEYDKIIVAINNPKIVEEVIDDLVDLGVERRSIVWEKIITMKLEE